MANRNYGDVKQPAYYKNLDKDFKVRNIECEGTATVEGATTFDGTVTINNSKLLTATGSINVLGSVDVGVAVRSTVMEALVVLKTPQIASNTTPSDTLDLLAGDSVRMRAPAKFLNTRLAGYTPSPIDTFGVYIWNTTATGPFNAGIEPKPVTFTFIRLGGTDGSAVLASWTDCFGSCDSAEVITVAGAIPALFRPLFVTRLGSQGLNAGGNLGSPAVWHINTDGTVIGYRNYASGSQTWAIGNSGFYSGSGSYAVA
jgi:hypothetical protein